MSRGKRWNRISETLNLKIFCGSMPPDPQGWVVFGATTFLPTCVRKVYQKIHHYGSSKVERIMIEIMITRKNRREPTLILQSANDVTNKIVKEIEKRDTLFGISFSFQQVQNWLQGSNIFTGSGIRICNNVGSGIKILWPKCEISRENIYLVKTLLYNKTM